MTDEEHKEMSFSEHLEELRSCLTRALLGILLASILCFVLAKELFSFLTLPLLQTSSAAKLELIGTGPAEAFIVKLKVAFVAGIILTLPYTFYQLWRFISPGLHVHERKLAMPFVLTSTLFFLLGVVFCYLVVFPFAFTFFLDEYLSIGTSPAIRIGEYLSFVVKLLLVFGLVFEMPVLTYFLARLRLVSHTWLIKQARFAIVSVFVLAAILTPPDIVTQCLLAGPLVILYALCIGVAYCMRGGEQEARDKTLAG